MSQMAFRSEGVKTFTSGQVTFFERGSQSQMAFRSEGVKTFASLFQFAGTRVQVTNGLQI